MKKFLLALSAVVAATALPTAAFADLAFNAGVVTDYRYRGISQSRLKPAFQGGVDFSQGGLYLGAWASSIKWIKDAGGGASTEIDLYGGYKGALSKDMGFDVGVLTYQYPSNDLPTSANTTEIYGALSFGPATLKYSHSVSNLFGFADSKNSGYLDLSASFDVGGGASLTPHIGYQKVAKNGDFSYADYSLTLAKDVGNGVSLTAAIVGTDADKALYVTPASKFAGKNAIVLGAKFGF